MLFSTSGSLARGKFKQLVTAGERRGLNSAPACVRQRGSTHVACMQHAPAASSTSTWCNLHAPLIWQGSTDEATSTGAVPQLLPPPWKVMVLSDGSVTRHLQLLTGHAVSVECMQMQLLDDGSHELPPGADQIPGPLVQRQVSAK